MRTIVALAGVPALLSMIVSTPSLGTTVYSYTGPDFGPFAISLTLDVPFSGSQLDNIAAGTSFLGDLAVFNSTAPADDEAGFPLGENDISQAPTTVEIGTDSAGNITSWDIGGALLFASYPAFPGENPTDFYCSYSLTTTSSGDQASLSTDNDAGFCPSGGSTVTLGTWSPTFDTQAPTPTPEPMGLALLGTGIATLAAARRIVRRAYVSHL